MTRVLIVEDYTVVAEGLAALLEDQPDLTVVGTADTAASAIEQAGAKRPDVVLLDYRLPDLDGAEAARAIHRVQAEVPILFLSRDDSDMAQLAAIEAGACGYLHKSKAATELVTAVRRAVRGEMLISGPTISRLLRRRAEADQVQEKLTDREREVLRLMVQGLDSKTIAHQLGIQYGTVRSHVRNLAGKLGAHSKIEAVARSRALGLDEA